MDGNELRIVQEVMRDLHDKISTHAENIWNAYEEMTMLFWIAVGVCLVLLMLIINLLMKLARSEKNHRLFKRGLTKEIKSFLKQSY